jgi:hypothetical protein
MATDDEAAGGSYCEVKIIPLTQGLSAKVDDADFEWLSQWKWYANKTGDSGCYYAARSQRQNGCMIKVYMHRLIMNCPDDKEIDHLNADPLDNRRDNLEITDRQTNIARRGRNGQ